MLVFFSCLKQSQSSLFSSKFAGYLLFLLFFFFPIFLTWFSLLHAALSFFLLHSFHSSLFYWDSTKSSSLYAVLKPSCWFVWISKLRLWWDSTVGSFLMVIFIPKKTTSTKFPNLFLRSTLVGTNLPIFLKKLNFHFIVVFHVGGDEAADVVFNVGPMWVLTCHMKWAPLTSIGPLRSGWIWCLHQILYRLFSLRDEKILANIFKWLDQWKISRYFQKIYIMTWVQTNKFRPKIVIRGRLNKFLRYITYIAAFFSFLSVWVLEFSFSNYGY